MARAQTSRNLTAKEKQEDDLIKKYREEYWDPDEEIHIFPPEVLVFNVFFDGDKVVCFGAAPAEFFDLTGHMFDQSFMISGLDEDTWFETMEGFWETEVYETLEEAADELEDLGLTRNVKLSGFEDKTDEDEDEEDEDIEDDDDAETDLSADDDLRG
jgi:hypothetical protein